MKTTIAVVLAFLLCSCSRRSSLVTVGESRAGYEGEIICYEFYSRNFVKYFNALRQEERRGVVKVREVSDNQLEFCFEGLSKEESDSALAAIFASFARATLKVERYEWQKNQDVVLDPLRRLYESDPEKFRDVTLRLAALNSMPNVHVYVLRIE